MVVCLCSGLSENAIQAVIASGASSVNEVAKQCGAGADCRACCPMIAALLEHARGTRYSDGISSRKPSPGRSA